MNDVFGPARAGRLRRLARGQTRFRFVERWRRWFLLSAVVIGAGVVSLAVQGLNFGIEFRGGTAWQLDAPGVSVREARDALRGIGLAGARIQTLGGGALRVQADVSGDSPEAHRAQQGDVAERLATLGGQRVDQVSINDVGPSWGEEISSTAFRALAFFLVVIFGYITFRFEWKMAVATLAALVHDLLVTVGVYSLFQFEVTPATVVAVLTILGYSIYDGIVVFDKVDENTRGLAASGRSTYAGVVDQSLNQVLMRTISTTITTLMPVLSLLVVGALILGASTLQDFALALLVGLLAGAYSSLFIASPLLVLLKERERRYASIRDRAAGNSSPKKRGSRR